MKIGLIVLFFSALAGSAADFDAGFNVISSVPVLNGSTISITNTNGANVKVTFWDCSSTNLVVTRTNSACSTQGPIGQPLTNCVVATNSAHCLGTVTVSNGNYAIFSHPFYSRGIVVSNSGPVSISINPP